MTEPRIHRASTANVEELADVYQSAYQENRELGFPAKAESVTPETISEWIEESQMYVAEIEGQVVGGVRLEVTGSERVKLSRLGVHEQWKGEGIGRQLLAHAEERVRNQDYATVWLTTPEDHPYLPELYRRHGYERTEMYPLEYRDYDEIVMEKRV